MSMSKFNQYIPVHDIPWILNWLKLKNEEVQVNVDLIPFSKMTHWYVDQYTGNIKHESGKFFSIEGIDVSVETEFPQHWTQPIINKHVRVNRHTESQYQTGDARQRKSAFE